MSRKFAMKVPGGSRNKRVMVLYTPMGLHGPAMLHAQHGSLEPTMATLASDFVEASRNCVDLLDTLIVNLTQYGHCIGAYFEYGRYLHHTGLRGMAIFPQIPLLGHYCKPGFSVPVGHLYTLPVAFPRIGGDPGDPSSARLWIVANAPIRTA